MKKTILATAISVVFFVLPIFADNIIQNGSFELPGFTNQYGQERIEANSTKITNWTISGGNVYLHEYPIGPAQSFGPTEDGLIYLDLSGYGPTHGIVYQDFATSLDDQYLLTFYIGASDQSSPSPTINVQLQGVSVLLDTTLTPLAPNVNGINWLEESFLFTPDSTTTRLSFVDTSGSDDNASFVDNVSITSMPTTVPEPATLGLLSLGLLSFLFLRRQKT